MNVISLLIVEDDKDTCKLFEDYINTRNDVNLIGTTNSSSIALELTKNHIPDAIILDLELHERRWFWL